MLDPLTKVGGVLGAAAGGVPGRFRDDEDQWSPFALLDKPRQLTWNLAGQALGLDETPETGRRLLEMLLGMDQSDEANLPLDVVGGVVEGVLDPMTYAGGLLGALGGSRAARAMRGVKPASSLEMAGAKKAVGMDVPTHPLLRELRGDLHPQMSELSTYKPEYLDLFPSGKQLLQPVQPKTFSRYDPGLAKLLESAGLGVDTTSGLQLTMNPNKLGLLAQGRGGKMFASPEAGSALDRIMGF